MFLIYNLYIIIFPSLNCIIQYPVYILRTVKLSLKYVYNVFITHKSISVPMNSLLHFYLLLLLLLPKLPLFSHEWVKWWLGLDCLVCLGQRQQRNSTKEHQRKLLISVLMVFFIYLRILLWTKSFSFVNKKKVLKLIYIPVIVMHLSALLLEFEIILLWTYFTLFSLFLILKKK